MDSSRRMPRSDAPFLLIALVAAIGIFGAPGRYGPALSALLTTVQLMVIGAAGWLARLPACCSDDEERRRLAIVGVLFIMLSTFRGGRP
jgi:hypothetical protein